MPQQTLCRLDSIGDFAVRGIRHTRNSGVQRLIRLIQKKISFVQETIAKTFLRRWSPTYSRFHTLRGQVTRFWLFYLFERITLFADASGWTSVKAIFASRKTASIASGTVPARSQWKPLSKSLPHLGS